MRLVKQEVVQTKYYITIILYQELYTYVVPVNVGCSYKVYFSGFHCGKLINNFIKITLFHFVSFNPEKKKFSLNRFWLSPGLAPGRGVQYVHWVMHKCIMVKVGGKNTHKVCKKLLNLWKQGGNFGKQGE